MKICPQCNNRYTDEMLKFCLQDGTELVDESADYSTNPTVAFGETETETVISSKKPERISFDINNEREDSGEQHRTANIPPPIQAEPKSSKTLLAVLATAFGMLLLFGIIGMGAYFYMNGKDSQVAINENNKNTSTDSDNNLNKNVDSETPTPEKTAKPTPEKSKESKPTPLPDENPEATKKAVTDTVYNWTSAAESGNLGSYMSYYALNLDYYNKKNASRSFVQNDKQRAFSKYDNISSTLSNMKITPSADGKTAVAVFDKQWLFTGEVSESSGKVQSQLKFKKDGDRWLITSERDLKVYYVNK